MALINCPECTKEVSDSALKCPSCGIQLRVAKRSQLGQLFKVVFILFNIIMAISMYRGFIYLSGTEGVERAGASIGTTWLAMKWVIGDIILGFLVLLTRPKQ